MRGLLVPPGTNLREEREQRILSARLCFPRARRQFPGKWRKHRDRQYTGAARPDCPAKLRMSPAPQVQPLGRHFRSPKIVCVGALQSAPNLYMSFSLSVRLMQDAGERTEPELIESFAAKSMSFGRSS